MDGQTTSTRIPDAAARMASAENMIRMAEAPERIQRAAGIAFPVPEHWSSEDALNGAFYDELLHKGQAPYPSPSFTHPMPLEGVRRLLAQGPLPRVSMTGRQNRTARLLGAELPLPAPITVETQQLRWRTRSPWPGNASSTRHPRSLKSNSSRSADRHDVPHRQQSVSSTAITGRRET
jgi:hypothetical protein